MRDAIKGKLIDRMLMGETIVVNHDGKHDFSICAYIDTADATNIWSRAEPIFRWRSKSNTHAFIRIKTLKEALDIVDVHWENRIP